MAKLPTPEESARVVLQIYAHFNSRPGHVLHLRNFMAVAADRRLQENDVISGLEKGVELGWFEEAGGGSFRLTDAGFDEM